MASSSIDFGVVHIRELHHRTDKASSHERGRNTFDSERLVLLPLPETALVAGATTPTKRGLEGYVHQARDTRTPACRCPGFILMRSIQDGELPCPAAEDYDYIEESGRRGEDDVGQSYLTHEVHGPPAGDSGDSSAAPSRGAVTLSRVAPIYMSARLHPAVGSRLRVRRVAASRSSAT